MRECPYCAEQIQDRAIKCRYCGSMLAQALGGAAPSSGAAHPGSAAPPAGPDSLDRLDTIPSFNDGTVIHGRYEVLFKLGEGGMGKVYLTRDREMAGEFRAVKILPRQVANDLKAIGRLKEEARIAMGLNQENIVRLYHYDHEAEVHYLVMEYVNGIDLQTYLGVKGRLPEDEVRRIGLEIARGLKHAHSRKVVHRDIKPSNILLESAVLDVEEVKGKYPDLTEADLPDLTGAKVRLTDFGIARQVRESMSRYSRGDTSGTLMYMSPEQVRGKGVDQRSDLYSLGVTLYELLTGDPPFTGESLTHQILSESPAAVEGSAPWFNAVLMRLLAKDKEKRFRDADELIQALEGKDGAKKEAEAKMLAEVERESGAEEERRAAEEARRAEEEKRREKPKEHAKYAEEEERQETRAKAQQGATAKPQQDTERRFANSLGMTFVLIPAGSFTMGSPQSEPGRSDNEGPHHYVTISREFYLQTTPVTQGQWDRVMRADPQKIFLTDDVKDIVQKLWGNHPSHDLQHPVTQVSWNGVQEFIRRLNAKEGSDRYRLPTEAEWEYAARAGSEGMYCFGNDEEMLKDFAWYHVNAEGKIHCVGEKKPNAWGLHDMHGNVWEWVQDRYGSYPSENATDPMGPQKGSYRVVRGGSWRNLGRFCRSAIRGNNGPGNGVSDIGFRLARTL